MKAFNDLTGQRFGLLRVTGYAGRDKHRKSCWWVYCEGCYCAGRPEEKLRTFMEYAVSLGADRAMWTRSQFARMPDGTRDNGNRQTVFYFNPGGVKS